ncbi:MAG: hypothetical protein ABR616_10300 [Dermatophilaceae bacterium]
MSDPLDTGDIAEVPLSEQIDVDEGDGADASAEGLDDDLDDVYADPGDVVIESFV